MIVCHCANVTDRDIRAAAHAGATTLRDIIKTTGAGRCCPPCRDEIDSILQGLSLPVETVATRVSSF